MGRTGPKLTDAQKKERQKEHARRWRESNRDRVNAQSRAYYSRQDMRAYHLKRKYNLTPKEFDRMLSDQEGRCAICGCPMKKPQIDHCHTTGRVRGLLCIPCNVFLGALEKYKVLGARIKEYLK